MSQPSNGVTSQSSNPIYATCEFCQLAIRPGESHGVIGSGEDGEPKLTCKILRLELVESEIPATHPASVLSGR